jgi:hypothetical protein
MRIYNQHVCVVTLRNGGGARQRRRSCRRHRTWHCRHAHLAIRLYIIDVLTTLPDVSPLRHVAVTVAAAAAAAAASRLFEEDDPVVLRRLYTRH